MTLSRKNNLPKISIIIPMYNVEKYLRRCLDSVANQTFQEWQAICVDDGSPDNSGKIAEEYAAKDKRFVVVHKENGGVSNARNIGISRARGQYIMFLDSDDCIHHQTLEIAYKFAVENDADLVSWRYDQKLYDVILNGGDINNNVHTRDAIFYNIDKIKYKQTDNLINFATERNHSFGAWNIRHCYPVVHLFRRDLIKDIKFNTNIKISEDFPFWTSVLLGNPMAVILKTPLYFYIPNVSSALRGADARKVFINTSAAIMESWAEVVRCAPTQEWMKRWNREFLWPFVITMVRALHQIDSVAKTHRQILSKLYKTGMFNTPPTRRAKKYKRRIEEFISGSV